MTTGPLRCELVTSWARLEELAPDWERLHAAARPSGGVFQRWAWARAYWTTQASGLSLCTPVVHADGGVIGILPLAIHDGSMQLLGAPYTDYNGLLCRAEHGAAAVEAALDALLGASTGWSECVLEGIPESSALMHAAASLPARLSRHIQAVFGSACPTAINDDGERFDRLSRKESLRRHENRLARRGAIRFRHIEDREEILAHMDGFIRCHVARHAASGEQSPLASPRARALLEALVAEFDPARELRFALLELDGRPVAYHLGFQDDGRFTYYMPTFDLEFASDGPGEVMLRRLLQYAHAQRLDEFDFTVGDEPYKARFATHIRRTFTIYLYRRPHQATSELRRLVRGARDAARRRPAVVACMRPVLRTARRLRTRTLARVS